jgi:hypothetical protein
VEGEEAPVARIVLDPVEAPTDAEVPAAVVGMFLGMSGALAVPYNCPVPGCGVNLVEDA